MQQGSVNEVSLQGGKWRGVPRAYLCYGGMVDGRLGMVSQAGGKRSFASRAHKTHGSSTVADTTGEKIRRTRIASRIVFTHAIGLPKGLALSQIVV